MSRRRPSLSLLAVTVAAGVLLASGCTTTTVVDADAVVTRVPDAPVTVVADPAPEARALATSAAFFASSPLVVLAPVGDPGAIAEAAERAEEWGVPLLLGPEAGAAADDAHEAAGADGAVEGSTASASGSPQDGAAQEASPLAGELGRLGARRVATLGDVVVPEGADVESGPAADVSEGDVPDRGDAREDALVLTAASTGPDTEAAAATARAAGAEVEAAPEGGSDLRSRAAVDLLHGSTTTRTVLLGTDFGALPDPAWTVAAARTGAQLPGGGQAVFDQRRYVALYGAPEAPVLGVLGEQGPEAAARRAAQLTAEYEDVSDRPVLPMMEIIATVAAGDPGPDGDYSNELSVEALLPYVEAAEAAGQYVVIDLQPGRTDFLTQAKRYEELLRRPGVGLALDPEWRLAPDQVHLRQIGGVDASEVDAVSSWLADLVRDGALPQKMFVLHQFTAGMLRDRAAIDVSRPELATVIHVDGQGSQPDKKATWDYLHQGAPEGIHWGWKNFYDEDEPMLSPAQTMADVAPVPDIVTYQ
ncbi:hypothetical protein [Frigoribacterium salinisoli]